MNHYQVCLTCLYVCPKQIKLLSNEKFRCRKIPYVVQYYVPNKKRALKNMCTTYFLCTIRLENEKELLSGNSPIYVSKFSEPGVIEVVNQNCSLVDPFATIVDDAFLRISWDTDSNMDPYGQQENDEVNENIDSETQSADLGNVNAFTNQLRVVLDENVINKNIRSLNMEHREICNFAHKWSRDFIKSLGCKIHQNVEPFYIFIMG